MLAFDTMLVIPAERHGIAVPENLKDYDKEDFPHWYVYCALQLGQAMPRPDSHWNNAEVISNIPSEKLITMTFKDFQDAGFETGFPIP